MAIIRWGAKTVIRAISWLWKPLIAFEKVTMLEGDGGDGKTTLILTIAAMLSRGELPPTLRDGKLYPSEPVEPATTFYLTNEDEISDSSLLRFVRAGGDVTRFAYSGEMEHHVTLTEAELLQIIAETGAWLVIIDPFQAFLPEGYSLGNISRMRAVFTMLSNVAKSTGAAIVLVGHLNKNEGGKDIHRGFGSADIAASVRSILLVERDEHRNRFVRAIKSNFDESDYSRVPLYFDEQRRLSFWPPEAAASEVKEESVQAGPEAGEAVDHAVGAGKRESSDLGLPDDAAAAASALDASVVASAAAPQSGIAGGTKADPGSSRPEETVREGKKLARSAALLRVLLESGPVPVAEIHRWMQKENISPKTAQRARVKLGAVQAYENGVRCWKLPG